MRNEDDIDTPDNDVSILSLILDNMNDPVYLLNKTGQFSYVNKLACNILGYSFQDLQKMHMKDIDSKFTDNYQRDYWNNIKNQNSITFNDQLKTKEGKFVSVEINAKIFNFNSQEYNLCLLKPVTTQEKGSENSFINENLFKRIIETSNQGIMAINADNVVMFANKKILEMLKYEESALINQPILKMYLKEDFESFNQKVENRRKLIPEIFERRLLTGDGKIIWSLISATPIINEAGKYAGSFALVSDITDRKKADNELLNLNRIYLTLSACNEALVHITNENELLNTICNIIVEKGGYKLAWVGYPQYDEDKTVKPVASAGTEGDYLKEIKISWEDNTLGRGPTGKAIRTKEIQVLNNYSNPDFAVWKETAIKHGFSSGVALPLLDNNEVIGAINIYSNVENDYSTSEISLLEELANDLAYGISSLRIKLKQEYTMNLLNDAQRIAHIGNFEFLPQENEFTLSDEVYRIYEINPDTFNSSFDELLELVHPDDKELVRSSFRRSIETHQPYSIDHRLLFSDGRIKFLHAHGETYFNEKNQPIRLLGILQDVTLAKQTEIEREAHLQLEIINKELETFSYTVSHDLRTPLHNQLSYLQLLRENCQQIIGEKGNQYLSKAIKLSEQMDQLIEDILSLSRIEYLGLKMTSININDLIQEIILEFQPEVQNRKINWEIAIIPSIIGDRNLIRLVLVNLLSNALKFTRTRSQTTVTIGSWSNDIENTIFVQDNGVGFDITQKDKLFAVFQRLHSDNEFDGTGIGLANAQRIVKRHGGQIWADSEIGKGSTFYFSIPKAIKTTST